MIMDCNYRYRCYESYELSILCEISFDIVCMVCLRYLCFVD